MAVPEVNKQMLEELESMGFPTVRAIRALHFSGNSTTEAAIDWLLEHENDRDIDEIPLVHVNVQIENGTSWMTPDEVRTRLERLRELARKNRDVEEQRLQREREKERIRAGKELQEATRINEENERKRNLLLRKVEKEEEKRARERIRQKLEEDKAERRRQLRSQPQDPAVAKHALSVQENKGSIHVKPTARAEHMRDCLRSLKKNHKNDGAGVQKAFATLAIYVRNVAKNPEEEKFRKIRLGNLNFQDRVGRLKGGMEFLELCGFEKVEGDKYLYLPRDKVDLTVLNAALSQLHSAMENPFFGVL
ncbi:UBX domain-containing protein 1-like [Zingiber officinale]|uniref:UBX domain-containing protein 1-like n=1 Tax=Zingiber officinale TaxID=94328 RepID=UPI001C4B5894|nr:UBX domain-containing protein 1-like [Zingiber officinale]